MDGKLYCEAFVTSYDLYGATDFFEFIFKDMLGS